MRTTPPYFITFEGIDTCGKTTQLKKAAEFLAQHNIPHVVEKEPGSTALGGTLRRILKEPAEVYHAMNLFFANNTDFTHLDIHQKRTPEAELFLFLASRADFLHHVVVPQRKQGKSVLSDRFSDSTRTYQGGGLYQSNPEDLAFIQLAHAFLFRKNNIQPDLTFLLDIPVPVMKQRSQGQRLDAIEERGDAYFERVRQAYLTIAKQEPERVVSIDGTQSIDTIFVEHLKPHLQALYSVR